MASYTAPLREISFVLNEVLKAGNLAKSVPNFADATPEIIQEMIETAAKFVEQELFPLNASGDAEGCTRHPDNTVSVPKGFTEAFKAYAANGFVGISNPTEYGGLGMPYLLWKVVEEMVCSGNVAFALYPGLTGGCFEALHASASEEIKQTYLHKLSSGEWTGTMLLTEPQAGSDLAAVKTKAIPQADGSYKLEGGKIFITSGEHGMADNIIHFALARIEGAPAGVKGLSTFVVPKFLVKADGSLGERNAIYCSAIEHKMGIHGSVTSVMNLDGATGWIVGNPNEGIQNMFVMMNLARIMVGFQGLGQMELATQNALRYALERKQPKPIIDFPDVRRMILQMKAMTEGARVLAYETALYVDYAHHHPDPAVREEANDWVELNTPLVKSTCTDGAVDLGSMAIQVYGGHGFIVEHGIEQILRDSKILCLYEGTNGIQAMDLVRRKLFLNGGRSVTRFFSLLNKAAAEAAPEFAFIAGPLKQALADLESATQWIYETFRSKPEDASFGCCDYQRAFALTYLGYNWLRMAQAASAQSDELFKAGKLATAHYFAAKLLPQVGGLCATVKGGAEDFMALPAASL
ncbi:acyl-CoA dehydrogenase [Stagnimonas aquatica]|uniref:3-methylmercaptopropionyl-CoA dehydrogenase n=1 Tax=Stagnimonas aquatica TaxID=2689987 RepID=A0A3N0VG55_9GAMM|nr:acyl-CoA dehydrogenase C-terminal domain-containing protein [Stagnimonas aquatica]ROH91674.1 acyl-CoA dehydrogenase [Stagnimonas aquatica]